MSYIHVDMICGPILKQIAIKGGLVPLGLVRRCRRYEDDVEVDEENDSWLIVFQPRQ